MPSAGSIVPRPQAAGPGWPRRSTGGATAACGEAAEGSCVEPQWAVCADADPTVPLRNVTRPGRNRPALGLPGGPARTALSRRLKTSKTSTTRPSHRRKQYRPHPQDQSSVVAAWGSAGGDAHDQTGTASVWGRRTETAFHAAVPCWLKPRSTAGGEGSPSASKLAESHSSRRRRRRPERRTTHRVVAPQPVSGGDEDQDLRIGVPAKAVPADDRT